MPYSRRKYARRAAVVAFLLVRVRLGIELDGNRIGNERPATATAQPNPLQWRG